MRLAVYEIVSWSVVVDYGSFIISVRGQPNLNLPINEVGTTATTAPESVNTQHVKKMKFIAMNTLLDYLMT